VTSDFPKRKLGVRATAWERDFGTMQSGLGERIFMLQTGVLPPCLRNEMTSGALSRESR
jgi:hypothetical protein